MTPGHTPESIGVSVIDPSGSTAPFAVFTGDTISIGYAGGLQIGAGKFSTLRLQKLGNYACRPMSREAFIDLPTTDPPARPIATSLVERAGFTGVLNLVGGFDAVISTSYANFALPLRFVAAVARG